MPDLQNYSYPLRVSELPTRRSTRFKLEPDSDVRAQISAELQVLQIRKLRFEGDVSSAGKSGWKLEGQLGATVVQTCVVSLEPVSTRIEQSVSRRYLDSIAAVTDAEIEMPEDDSLEPLSETIDVGLVMFEALALAIPVYPRREDSELDTGIFTEPGQKPMSDEDAKPFASLAALRDKLNKGD